VGLLLLVCSLPGGERRGAVLTCPLLSNGVRRDMHIDNSELAGLVVHSLPTVPATRLAHMTTAKS
jgi:hypothetical protein